MKTLSKLSTPFWEPLLQLLNEKLSLTEKETANDILQQAQKSILICVNLMNDLQSQVLNLSFSTQSDEIYFFKEIKPKFYGRLIYYHKMYNIEVGLPVGGLADLNTYYQKELERIKSFYEENKFYYLYYRNRETYLDDKLFTRNRQGIFLPSHIYDINTNPAFSTNYDYIFSRILANEMLLSYLTKRQRAINSENNPSLPLNTQRTKSLTWTDSKVALIELAYAFKAKGSFNSGKATLKDITDFLQEVFSIELTNPSRDFQEILRRKTGYTSFLDSLKENYLKYIDSVENKERR